MNPWTKKFNPKHILPSDKTLIEHNKKGGAKNAPPFSGVCNFIEEPCRKA